MPDQADETTETETAPHELGDLDGFGRCMDCGLDWSGAPGVYFCHACSED